MSEMSASERALRAAIKAITPLDMTPIPWPENRCAVKVMNQSIKMKITCGRLLPCDREHEAVAKAVPKWGASTLPRGREEARLRGDKRSQSASILLGEIEFRGAPPPSRRFRQASGLHRAIAKC